MKTFYVSSYGKNDDKGIYIMKFDEQTLEMKYAIAALNITLIALRMRERLEEYYSLRNIQHTFQTGFSRSLHSFRCIPLQALTWCPSQRTLQ